MIEGVKVGAGVALWFLAIIALLVLPNYWPELLYVLMALVGFTLVFLVIMLWKVSE